MTQQKPQRENLFISLLFNVILPVLLLKKAESFGLPGGQITVLLLALSFPLIYGALDYFKTKKTNLISALGIVNILITGGFALAQLEGRYFALKEAGIPFFIGLFVFATAFKKKTFTHLMFLSSGLFPEEQIQKKLEEKGTQIQFHKHLKLSTLLWALSFFVSAVLNFIVALQVFTPISKDMSSELQKRMLNDQIADMTWKGYVMIGLPMLLGTAFILWHFFRGLTKYTGLTIEELTNPALSSAESDIESASS